MGIAGLKATCGVVFGVLPRTSGLSVYAHRRAYDMNRMLAEPHPYQAKVPTQGSHPVATRLYRAPARTNRVPLPGSQYRISGGPAMAPANAAFRAAPRSSVPYPPTIQVQADANNTPPPAFTKPARKKPLIAGLVVGGFVHDPAQDNNEANTFDLNLEVIFRKVTFATFENRYLRFLFSPHPVFGVTINTEDETHTAYLALHWQYDFDNRLFLAGAFGFAAHTGNLDQAERQCAPGEGCSLPGNRAFVDTGEVTLGSRILFRESIELGYWVAERHGISVYFAHVSNASLFDEDNDGMNFLGLRYRYAFD